MERGEVDREHAVPGRRVELVRRARMLHEGVAVQDVQPAELGTDHLSGGPPVRLGGHVAVDVAGGAARVADLRGDAGAIVVGDVEQQYGRSLGRQPARARGADPTGGAGDGGDPPRETGREPSPSPP